MNFKITLTGPSLMMHNGQLVDPLNDYSKALKAATSKKKKTDEDHEKISRAEFQGGLYHDEEVGPFVPGEWLQSAMIQGARAVKLGKQFESSVIVVDDVIKLMYSGPRDREGLWANKKFVDRSPVKVQQARVMRTRPMFKNWTISFTVEVLDNAVNREDVEAALVRAGNYIGIGDGRPRRAGKFVIQNFEEVK